MNELKELLKIHNANNEGHRFQSLLAECIRKDKPEIIVEVGSGLSSLFIADALNDNDFGKLYSIDPAPWSTIRFAHPRVEFIEKCSDEALVEVFLKTGYFDIAISDGNHDIKAQTYEYEFMFACLKGGGYLIADDTTWGNHGAWDNFLGDHNLKEGYFGDARIIQKPVGTPVVVTDKNAESFHKQCLEWAENREHNWLSAGNKNSSIEWVRV